jgi:hypothetical protein
MADLPEDPELAALRAPRCPHPVDYVALGAGLVPFFISFKSTHTESITFTGNIDPKLKEELNAKATHTEFKDPVALAGGGVALVLALVSLAFWRGTLPQKKALRIGLTVGAALLGVLQLVVRSGILT